MFFFCIALMSVYLLICVSVRLFLFVFSARVYCVYVPCCLIQINKLKK